MPTIRLENLTKRYGDTMAADDITFTIEDGEYLCILGPTGAGKTTCMRLICGLTEPDSGRIFYDDVDVTLKEVENRETAMLSQSYSLFPQMNVRENVLFGPKIKGWPEESSKHLARNMLRMVHLEDRADAYPNQLSGGMQQRIALARALASGSKVLLLDEPLRALDARLRIELRKELRSLAKEMGLTAIHVTHDQDEAMEMADRIAIIRQGKIIQTGTPREIYEHPKTPFVANFMGRSNMFVGTVDNGNVILQTGTRIEADCSGHSDGDNVVVAVKVGNTKISRSEEEGYFKGTIERILYEGVSIVIDINVPEIGTIMSRLPNRKYDEYEKGDVVSVIWNQSKTSVFDIPEGGLENELRVD